MRYFPYVMRWIFHQLNFLGWFVKSLNLITKANSLPMRQTMIQSEWCGFHLSFFPTKNVALKELSSQSEQRSVFHLSSKMFHRNPGVLLPQNAGQESWTWPKSRRDIRIGETRIRSITPCWTGVWHRKASFGVEEENFSPLDHSSWVKALAIALFSDRQSRGRRYEEFTHIVRMKARLPWKFLLKLFALCSPHVRSHWQMSVALFFGACSEINLFWLRTFQGPDRRNPEVPLWEENAYETSVLKAEGWQEIVVPRFYGRIFVVGILLAWMGAIVHIAFFGEGEQCRS